MTQINIQNKKRAYEKPSMEVYELEHRAQILTGSSVPVDPSNPSPEQW